MKKLILKEVKEEPRDLKYEFFRALKTFCLIVTLFCIGFFLKKNYADMLQNCGDMRYFPASTMFYIDGIDNKDLVEEFKLNTDIKTASYGIIKDKYGKDKIIAIIHTPTLEDTHILSIGEYYLITNNGITFISNSENELSSLKQRVKNKQYEFLKNRNIKKFAKNLDAKRDKTIVISDISYTGITINQDARKAFNKIFDVAVIQTKENEKEIQFWGEIAFKSKFADAALNIKKLSENFLKRNIKIEDFNSQELAMTVAIRDFDLWSTTLVKILKALPDNQYNATFKLIQTVFNFDIEQDIVNQLNGNAVFYMYKEKRTLHPMLLLETKKDLAVQGKKYLNFLQLTNNSKLSEKELGNKTFNILSSGFYPYNLSFGSIDDSVFILGHQNIIEKYIADKNIKSRDEKCDVYMFFDIKKLASKTSKHKDKSFWRKYKTLETRIFMAPNMNFYGTLEK